MMMPFPHLLRSPMSSSVLHEKSLAIGSFQKPNMSIYKSLQRLLMKSMRHRGAPFCRSGPSMALIPGCHCVLLPRVVPALIF